ncbi:MAG: MerR family transcriptional regulator [Candidatus Dormibacteria bacterium]
MGLLTIEELALEVGMTVRNIRAHQARGLLPAPEVRGRIGYYGEEHVARLQMIIGMQADGFNLGAIRKILDGMRPGSAGQVLGLERALRAPWGEEVPIIVSEAELVAALGVRDTASALVKKTVKMDLVRPLGEQRYEVTSPTIARAGRELERLGVPPEARVELQERLLKHADRVAQEFTALYLEHVWKPFDEAGRPESEIQGVLDALERLRPLARETLMATFNLSIGRILERAVAKEIQKSARR